MSKIGRNARNGRITICTNLGLSVKDGKKWKKYDLYQFGLECQRLEEV